MYANKKSLGLELSSALLKKAPEDVEIYTWTIIPEKIAQLTQAIIKAGTFDIHFTGNLDMVKPLFFELSKHIIRPGLL